MGIGAGRWRVLYFGHTAKLGGGEIALLNTLAELDRTRFVPLVVLGEAGPLIARLRVAGIETQVLALDAGVGEMRKGGLGGRTLLRLGAVVSAAAYVWRLVGVIRRSRVDLVHTNTLKGDFLGGIAALLAGKPVLWHVRDRIHPDYLPARVVTVVRWACALLADYVVCPSEAVMALLRPTYVRVRGEAAARARLRVIHDGVVLGAFDTVAQREPRPRADGPTRVGLLGRISPFKGQRVFVEAAAQVLKSSPNTEFLIVGAALFGEQAYEQEVRELVSRLGLGSAVRFTGFRSDVVAAVDELDVLVHASTTGEPFGQVIVEGMAARKPVVATDGGGVPEIVENGRTGILARMGDAGDLARAICEVLGDPGRAKQMGDLGRARVEAMFTTRHTAGKLASFYETIFAGERHGRSSRAVV